jgi:hypothetical protein
VPSSKLKDIQSARHEPADPDIHRQYGERAQTEALSQVDIVCRPFSSACSSHFDHLGIRLASRIFLTSCTQGDNRHCGDLNQRHLKAMTSMHRLPPPVSVALRAISFGLVPGSQG